jgi:uncharacterized protein (DUF4415 family)
MINNDNPGAGYLTRNPALKPRVEGSPAEYWKIEPVKVPLSIKVDADVLAWFRAGGKGYQTRMNAVLREAMLHSKTG